MSIISYFSELVKFAQLRTTRLYLIMANIALVIFGIWFSNAGLLPFAKISDFIVFSFLVFLLALYRPGWAFLFFIGSVALENINLAPLELGLVLRPYQFFGFLALLSFLILFSKKRIKFDIPKWSWFDYAVFIFAAAGFISSIFSSFKGAAFKQSIIMLSFIALYVLTRIYIQNLSDAKKVLPFFLSSSVVVLFYGIWQNIYAIRGRESFEVMVGRPNSTFTEADWLGIFIVLILTTVFTIIFYQNRKTVGDDEGISFFLKEFYNYKSLNLRNIIFGFSLLLLVLIFIVLILSVARSAWLGAIIVSIGFVKCIAFNGLWNLRNWRWKEGLKAMLLVLITFFIAFAIVKVFNLTKFDLFNRAQSTASGQQEITISCDDDVDIIVPKQINSVSELSDYGCVHINLEDIENEKNAGKIVSTVYRPDPNVKLRSEIYVKSFEQLKMHPVLGIGWGGIGEVLGVDERGASLNSSNIFLEIWLGAGLIGIFSFASVLIGLVYYGLRLFLKDDLDKKGVGFFVIMGIFAIIIPNLFNAGIFLGFLWIFLAVAVSLIRSKYIK